MNTTSKLIASVSLSLLTMGAMAQTPASLTPVQRPDKSVTVKHVYNSHAQTKSKVSLSSTNGLIDYVDGDIEYDGYTLGSDFTGWFPPLYFNQKYTAADTVYSPLSNANFSKSNQFTLNSCTVVFDTLWDQYQYLNTNDGFVDPQRGSVQVDTIWAFLRYRNTSGKSDTLIFTVCAVTKAGMPAATPVYGADTEIIAPHNHATLPGTSLDSTWTTGFVPANAIKIPATAVDGWHFCITTTVKGSKKDTLGVSYFSALATCNSANYCDSSSSMGVKNGSSPHTNAFVTGLYWYNSKDFGGNGTQITFPLSSGKDQGLWVNSGGQQFYNFTPSGCGFTWFPYIQDVGILASISYINTTGINNITNSGLSVNQNYPNPFNKSTLITYNLVKSSDVVFNVCDITGRTLVNTVYSTVAPGTHEINLDANSFAPGIYFYTFKVNGNLITKKMVITE